MTHSFPFTLAGALLALLLSLAATAEEILYYENREDIPEQYTWDLGLQFETVEDWEKAFAAVEAKLPELETYRGKVGASASNIAEALDKQFELWAMLGPVYIHPSQKNDLDRNDSEAAGQAGRAAGLMARLTEATSFIEPEIAAIPEREAKRYLSSEELEAYAHYLDNIWRLRDHYRSAEVEEVIAGSSLSGRGHREAYGNLNDADITWPTIKDENREDVVVSPGQFFRFQQSIDRDLRRRSFEAHLATIESYKNTFGATLGGKVQRDVWLARVYRYPSSLEAALSSTNVPAEVIETLRRRCGVAP